MKERRRRKKQRYNTDEGKAVEKNQTEKRKGSTGKESRRRR